MDANEKPVDKPTGKPADPDAPNSNLLRNIKGHDQPIVIGERPDHRPFQGIEQQSPSRKPPKP